MFRHSLITSGLLLALSGCVSTPQLLTQQEISTAQSANDLDSLYTQYAARLADYKLTTPEGQQAKKQLDAIGENLAVTRGQEIRRALKQKATPDGYTPLPVIAEESSKSLRMQQWAPSEYDALSADIDKIRAHTNARIKEQQDILAALSEDNIGKRPAILTTLAELSGDDRYLNERQATINQISQRIDDSFKAERYEDAKKALYALKEATPNDPAIPSKMLAINTRIFEKTFWDNLTNGKSDEAYALFIKTSQSADFPTILKGLSKSSDDMVAYYIAQSGSATADNRFTDAWKLLLQAYDIRARTNGNITLSPQEESFIDIVQHQYDTTQQATYPGASLGYLAVIEHINPNREGLQEKLQAAELVILNKIGKALAVSPDNIPASKAGEYAEIAKSYAKEGNFMLATESAAKAFVIAHKNQSNVQATRALLEEFAVKTLAP